MIYYFLPGHGIFGGIKVGYQFVEALTRSGVDAAVASPEGLAARWFYSEAPVVDRDSVLASWDQSDTAVFSLPDDYKNLRPHVEKLIYHCQGTDPAIDPLLEGLGMSVITCWTQAEEYVKTRGRNSFDVGIPIAESFYYSGETKVLGSVAYMPRRGAGFVRRFHEARPGVKLTSIDNLPEWEVARRMKCSQYFLASSEDEWFGLPALEAMAAGCVVLSPATIGGMEYLGDGHNCVVGAAEQLAEWVRENRDNQQLLGRMVLCAMATASRYSEDHHRSRVARLIEEGVLGR